MGYVLEFDVQYLKKLGETQNDLQFLRERMKTGKTAILEGNFHDKKEYVVHI